MIQAALALVIAGIALGAIALWRWCEQDDVLGSFSSLVVFGIGSILLLIGLFLALAAAVASLFAP